MKTKPWRAVVCPNICSCFYQQAYPEEIVHSWYWLKEHLYWEKTKKTFKHEKEVVLAENKSQSGCFRVGVWLLVRTVLVLIGFVSIWQTLDSSAKRKYQLTNWLWACPWGSPLINDWCRRAQFIMGGTPMAGGPWPYRKAKTEKARRQHPWLIFSSVLASKFLRWLPLVTHGDLGVSQVTFGQECLITAIKAKWRTPERSDLRKEMLTEKENWGQGESLELFSLVLSGSSRISKGLLCLIELVEVFLITSLVPLVPGGEAQSHGRSFVECAPFLPYFTPNERYLKDWAYFSVFILLLNSIVPMPPFERLKNSKQFHSLDFWRINCLVGSER